MLEKYGVEHPMYIDSIKNRVIEKGNKTMFLNKTVPTSKQQIYVCKFYDAIINYPFGKFNVDGYMKKYNIYIEWDGGGHRSAIYHHRISENDFIRQKIIRYKYLKDFGLKEFRIISDHDIIPNDGILMNMKEFVFQKLIKEDYNWIEFDVDASVVKYKGVEKEYIFK